MLSGGVYWTKKELAVIIGEGTVRKRGGLVKCQLLAPEEERRTKMLVESAVRSRFCKFSIAAAGQPSLFLVQPIATGAPQHARARQRP